ncbi:MAG: hypothetical protein EOO18_06170 [Chryseobacterium sp.]|jgi:hypothetical protein|nr:MAG: hypothetical protein EOO18_06170 [Chryseobacterium sp.]
MKKLKPAILFLIGMICNAQVGINTVEPTATLDINGDLRVRNVQACADFACVNAVLVKDNDGYVRSIPKDQLAVSNNVSYVSGTGSGTALLANVLLITNWWKIRFDKEIIDDNNDFDTVTNTFTTPKTGIYHVYVQSKCSALVTLQEFGVGIFVQKGVAAPSLAAEESFVNASVAGISVSPPTRSTEILLSLEAGDKIIFGVKSIISANLFSETLSFFTIHQVK